MASKTSKSRWTHRATWPDEPDRPDRLILHNGEVIARTYQHIGTFSGAWGWFGQGVLGGVNGKEETLDAVLVAVKAAMRSAPNV